MRRILNLEPFRSEFIYGFALEVQAAVDGENGLDDDIFFDFLDECPARAAKPFKTTLLHGLIKNVNNFYIDYSLWKFPDETGDQYRQLLENADIKCPEWLHDDKFMDYKGDLGILLSEAITKFCPSVFHLLFLDRAFLIKFQMRITSLVKRLNKSDHPEIMRADGILCRPKYIPVWLKEGVFYRDQGRCQHCWKDLSGLLNPKRDIHLDHIIPLVQSGSNDPTNFQLLCSQCNLVKGRSPLNQPQRFSPYW